MFLNTDPGTNKVRVARVIDMCCKDDMWAMVRVPVLLFCNVSKFSQACGPFPVARISCPVPAQLHPPALTRYGSIALTILPLFHSFPPTTSLGSICWKLPGSTEDVRRVQRPAARGGSQRAAYRRNDETPGIETVCHRHPLFKRGFNAINAVSTRFQHRLTRLQRYVSGMTSSTVC